MTAAELIFLMATMQCHTMTVNVPERRETIVQTVCVKTEVTPLKEEPKTAVKPAVKKKVTKCKRKYYWKNKRKKWRCVR